ncbi:MAG: tRNA pseudouridine(38-40) synthase TruA [Steroidobacteraceae bacterium]
MRIAVGIEYDGSGFAGWQLQRGLQTVQGAVEAAFTQVADSPIQVVCAGRTDTGVHAREQVAHFDTQAERSTRSWVLGANSRLVDAITVRWAQFVDPAFHARFTAQWRVYRYCILNRGERPALAARRAVFVRRPLDVARMSEAASALLGQHDFSAFRSSECQARSAVRTVRRLHLERMGEFVLLEVEANAFLHHMVRNIAGVLIAIGKGDAAPAWAAEVLASRDRRAGGVTAPAEGLYLWRVGYPPGFGLPNDSDMIADHRTSPVGCPADLLG